MLFDFVALNSGEIADRWGMLKVRADKIADEIKALKAEFDRRELLSARGLKFSVVKVVEPTLRLNIEAIRSEMGAAWCEARERPSTRVTYKVILRTPTQKRSRIPSG